MGQQTEELNRLAYRKKRVKRIKRFLVTALVVLLLIPNVLCGILMYQVYQMKLTRMFIIKYTTRQFAVKNL